MKWYLEVLRKYAVFSGRARRKEYWMFTLFNILIAIALAILDSATGLTKSGHSPLFSLSCLYGLAVFVPGVAVAVRRLHDTGHSGWWWLLLNLPGLPLHVPGVGVAVGRLHDTSPSEWWALISVLLVCCVVLLIFMVLDSAPGQNQYGPNPKQAVARPAVV